MSRVALMAPDALMSGVALMTSRVDGPRRGEWPGHHGHEPKAAPMNRRPR
jgi:hypothetical protein